jgi:hypothetical protein
MTMVNEMYEGRRSYQLMQHEVRPTCKQKKGLSFHFKCSEFQFQNKAFAYANIFSNILQGIEYIKKNDQRDTNLQTQFRERHPNLFSSQSRSTNFLAPVLNMMILYARAVNDSFFNV